MDTDRELTTDEKIDQILEFTKRIATVLDRAIRNPVTRKMLGL